MVLGHPELSSLIDQARVDLGSVHAAREAGLPACREVIRLAGSTIRAVHRREHEQVGLLLARCEEALRRAQAAVGPYPGVAYSGFLHDAEKEYAEAVLTDALVAGRPLVDQGALRVGLPAWLNGLAEAASELRRHILDRLRRGEPDAAESLFASMEDAYEAIVQIDFPDAITGGLRRSADALRAVLERTRSDLTTTLLQNRLQAALEGRAAAPLDCDLPR